MKRNFMFLILGLSAICTLAQNDPPQNPYWILMGNPPTGYSLHFSDDYPYSPSISQSSLYLTPTTPYTNSYIDGWGNLLFYIVDGYIYDNNGYQMDFFNYYALIKPAGEIVVFPDPGNCQRYYIFYYDSGGLYPFDPQLYYSILDVSQYPYQLVPDPGNPENNAIWMAGSGKGSSINIAASKLRTDNTRFFFAYGITIGTNLGGLYRYTINASGITFPPSFINPGNDVNEPNWGMSSNSNSALKLYEYSSGGVIGGGGGTDDLPTSGGVKNGGHTLDDPSQSPSYKIAGTGLCSSNYVWEMELDDNGNYITGTFLSHCLGSNNIDPYIYGLEFSPNGNYLYYTHVPNSSSQDPVEYLELLDGLGTNTALLTGPSVLGNAQIENGADGVLYFAVNNRLAKLSSPNTPNANNFTDNLQLGNPGSYILPYQIDGDDYYYNPGGRLTGDFTYTVNCNNNELSISVSSTEHCYAQTWFLYNSKGNLLQQSTGNQNNYTFYNLLPNPIYVVLHVVTDFCNLQNRAHEIINIPPLDPSFQLTHGNINPNDNTYGLTGTSINPSSFWTVVELDNSLNPMPNTLMTSNDNYLNWMNDPNSCIYQGYCCTHNSTTPGIFKINNLYMITHTTGNIYCYPPDSISMIYGILQDKDVADIQVISNIVTDTSKFHLSSTTINFLDFDIYPNPASDLLTIHVNKSEEMSFTVTNLIGKVLIPTTKYTGATIQLNVSLLESGLYFISNDMGVTKKLIIQK